MRINNNITALNTYRSLSSNNYNISKSMEKLSSGLRINKSGDDAAGLSISEKMRAQIRGLTIASKNCSDGISLVKTAEGGLNEMSEILQRIREISIQSSNGTYIDSDRETIQSEINELIDELESIATRTEFNTLSLLDGKYKKDGEYTDGVKKESLEKYVTGITTSGGVNDRYKHDSTNTEYASAIIDFSGIVSIDEISKLEGKGVNYTCCTCDKAYSIKFINGSPNSSRLDEANPVMEIDISSINNGSELADKIKETAYGQANFTYNPTYPTSSPLPSTATSFVNHFSQIDSKNGVLYIYDDRSEFINSIWPDGNGFGRFDLNVYGEEDEVDEDKVLIVDIQAGSNSEQTIRLEIPNVTLKKLNLEDLLVNTQQNANIAISKADNAISRVSKSRSSLGAYQNRLEYTIANLDSSAYNLQKAESMIRDVDMSTEMVRMSKYQILLQSSQAMLAQANQMSQGVLQLLK